MMVSALPLPTTLAEWIAATIPPGIPAMDAAPVGSLRFLFYGRASTHEHQDPRTSRAWQLDVSRRLTDGHGLITGEYFEVGCSRQVPWHLRPRAAAMLRYIAANADLVDAVVVGEYERAFLDGAQVRELRAVLEQYGVQLWLPEAEGPVDFANPAHEALLSLLSARSQTEVLRSRHRVVTAMRMQTVEQGRYLGGRPPYGYRLVDAGPHPNRALARRGVRQQRLVPNPATAPVVKLIFSLRLAGHSAAHIARHLNEQAVPSPSGVDAERERAQVDHASWSLRTVVEILGNPRYTGHQVWNRTSADRTTRSPTGRRTSIRNQQHDWAISTRIAHTPLVTGQDFVTAQTIQATRQSSSQADADDGETVYLLAGRLQCGLCGRKMDSHRSHGRAAYRCRHGHTTARTRPAGAPGNLYLREDHLLPRIAAHLATAGIADNPDPEQTARLIDELGLAFRCDAGSVTLLDRSTTTQARAPRRRPTPQPVHGMPGNEDCGRTGGQLLLALSYTTTSEADQPDTPASQVDAPARGTRPARRPLRSKRPAVPQRRYQRPRLHVVFGATRPRDAFRVGRAEHPPPSELGHDPGRQGWARSTGRRPLLLPSRRQAPHQQRPSGRLGTTSGNTMPHEASR
ncbi:DNA invertase Pin-like site-specific DNA recombinase [Saccharothrix ecbatanensis]|uniref:DNA invertase Pin-like site-specific DNA recombinase n=1 Tax=Saccharothrix ecbatanensis TaxID=1105145 RepID=A0A7W9M137_9PSEU|nr:recombinase family protein [Saccharothrix ecbatanensis]MBB5803473.1 DNA invertase Pin-like site-specific DNA recombinase [Saccharothrix ecbatanensis]